MQTPEPTDLVQPAAVPRQASRVDYADTTLLKCVAVLLIVNSHLEGLWPKRWMAADGLVGNSLFFAIAGFGLVLGLRSRPNVGAFLPWYWRRINRMYPAMILVVLCVAVFFGRWRSWGVMDYVSRFVWPTDYGFIGTIMPMYVVFYLILRGNYRAVLPWALWLCGAAYLVFNVLDARTLGAGERLSLGQRPGLVHEFAYFFYMLLGGWMAVKTVSVREKWRLDLALLLGIGVLYVGAKFMMSVGGRYAWAYGVLHVFVALIIFYSFRVGQARFVIDFIHRKGPLQLAAVFLGGLTLELYLVHEHLIVGPMLLRGGADPTGWRLPFPLNIIVLLVVSVAVAWALQVVVRLLTLAVTAWQAHKKVA